ncbi:MAG: PcfJ domain-containing protein [Sphingobacteriaceae bacterium]|nr:PcfJ domain-containing protein [Sphingobacteriaceae bacterium]
MNIENNPIILEYKIQIDKLGIYGTPNLKRLERLLGISVIDYMNNQITLHLKKINKYKFITEETDGVFCLYIKIPRKPKILFLRLEDGLLYDSNEWDIKNFMSYYRNARGLNVFDMQELLLSCFTSDKALNEKINAMANEDYLVIQNAIKYINIADEEEIFYAKYPSKYTLSKLNILTTEMRIKSYLHNNKKFNFSNLIGYYDIEKPIKSINREIRYALNLKIKDLILSKYTAAIKDNHKLYSTASKILISRKLLAQIPYENRDLHYSLYQKYPLAHSLVHKHNELIQFDQQNLILNDAHPKLIKKLVVSFYQSIAPISIAKNVVTRILRLNIRQFRKDNYNNLYYSHHRERLSEKYNLPFDVFLLLLFSSPAHIKYLSNVKEHKDAIFTYGNTYIDMMSFLDSLNLDFAGSIQICRKSFNSEKIDYLKFSNRIKNLKNEINRSAEYFSNNNWILLSRALKQLICLKQSINLKFINQLHDIIVNGIELYRQSYLRYKSNPKEVELMETKLIDTECYQGYVFEQLVTVDELSKEGQLMHHCVGSYFGSNINKLFIFAVYPISSENRFCKPDSPYNRSTLAIHVTESKKVATFSIDQNYTYYDDYPSEENQLKCQEFTTNLKTKYQDVFIDYLRRLKNNKRQKSKDLSEPFNESIILDQVMQGISIL